MDAELPGCIFGESRRNEEARLVSADHDGSVLLTTDAVADLLAAAVQHAGGRLIAWQLNHVDAAPNHSTTATYHVDVEWPSGRRVELIGVSARVGAPTASDANAEIFVDGDREVAVWIYPHDPDLPGLSRATHIEQVADLINSENLVPGRVSPTQIELKMIGYRPRRRAVVKVGCGDQVFYIKVLRPKVFPDVLYRHQLLAGAGLPTPEVLAATEDQLLVLRQLPGVSLDRAIFLPQQPCTGEQLVDLLDSMPKEVANLERRPHWSDAIDYYAEIVAQAMPSQTQRLEWLVSQITAGLRGVSAGSESTHGDFHEGQLFVDGGQIVGMLDIDTIGPGRRADDLACLIAHLSTVQGMNRVQEGRVRDLLRSWVPVFDRRVDPIELRLRAAAVIISLATGPFRGQDPDWQAQTSQVVGTAVALVRQVS